VILTPTASIITDVMSGCSPLTVNFQNETTDAVNYFWNLGDGNQYVGDTLSYSFIEPGVYDVQVIAINSNSCADTVNIDITVNPKPTAAFDLNAQDLDRLVRVSFQNQSLNAVAYEWNYGDGNESFITNPVYNYSKMGDCAYTPSLVAYNEFGCTDTAYRIVPISFNMRVWAPNSFTPNEDGLNDVFTLVTTDVDPGSCRLTIFDRWGVIIHEDSGLYPSWDGKIKGEYAPNDVYVWKYYARTKCGYEDMSQVGHVSVIR
jgi:gliding motility-associated-like protein